jgi:hypothetical protein
VGGVTVRSNPSERSKPTEHRIATLGPGPDILLPCRYYSNFPFPTVVLPCLGVF